MLVVTVCFLPDWAFVLSPGSQGGGDAWKSDVEMGTLGCHYFVVHRVEFGGDVASYQCG